jgi:hypothetical protein
VACYLCTDDLFGAEYDDEACAECDAAFWSDPVFIIIPDEDDET